MKCLPNSSVKSGNAVVPAMLPHIKEFVVRLPEGETLDFETGGYIQIEIPPYEADYSSFEGIEDRYKPDWDRFKVWDFKAVNTETAIRAYSMANYPAEGNIVMLNIRVATPPPDRSSPTGWKQVPPGIASSYIFSRKPGDKVTISGPLVSFLSTIQSVRWFILAVVQVWHNFVLCFPPFRR